MKINRATIEEFDSIITFYNDVTDRTPDMERFAHILAVSPDYQRKGIGSEMNTGWTDFFFFELKQQ